MTRTIAVPALALGLVLAVGGAVSADDNPAKPGIGAFTMTLGGQGTAAQAAAADTELTHGWKHRGYYGYYGGYRGYYGGFGYGYRPAYYGGFGYYGGYRPYVGYYRPYSYGVYRSYYYSPVVSYYGGWGYGYGGGFYCGISGDKSDATAPVVSLGMKVVGNPVVVREQAPATEPAAPGTFRYDGGPASPVPLPKPDAAAPSAGGNLPVSLPKAKPVSPYTYKAYGEK